MPTAQITHNTQHIAIGLDRFIVQFREKPRMAALAAAMLNEVQAVEDALYGLLSRALDDPDVSGGTLDVIGRIVGQTRQSQDDATFLRYIQARIATNLSDGRLETILSILLFLVGESTPIRVREYSKALELEADGVTGNAYQIWSQFLELAKDAGTSLRFIFSKSPAASTLKYTSSNSASLTTTTSQRFGSSWTVGVGGGVLAGEFG